MKIVYAYALAMVIPLTGGCTEHRRSDTKVMGGQGIDVEVVQPDRVTRYHIPDAIYPTLITIKKTLAEIDAKVKGMKSVLDGTHAKASISEDLDIRGTVEEIDLKISEVKTALDIASKRVQISGDIVQIIAYVRPKLSVELDPDVLCSDKKIRMTFNLTNRGEHSVSVGEPQLTFSTERIRGRRVTARILLPDDDYTLQWEGGSSYAAPSQTVKCIADMEIRDAELEGRPLYYSLCVDTETTPEIVDILSDLLFDSLDTYKLHRMSRASLTFTGEIPPSALPYPD